MRSTDRVRVAMDNLPGVTFAPEYRRHSEIERGDLLSATHLGPPMLHLQDAGKLLCQVLRQPVEAGDLPITKTGRGEVERCRGISPADDGRAERVGEGQLVRRPAESLDWSR